MKMITFTLLTFLTFSPNAVSSVDSNEEFPAGTGTTSDFSVQAFSHPLSGTRGALRREFQVGNSFFNTVWVATPASTTARDGLGPIYNAVSCSSCHFKDGRGRGLPEEDGITDVSLLFRLRVKTLAESKEVIPHPVYGGQFQPQGVAGVPGEGISTVRFEKIQIQYHDGFFAQLIKPIYSFLSLNYGPFTEATIVSPRVAPQMIGLGLIEAIKESDILKNEDPFDADGDGISGRANRVYSVVNQSITLGRFGWKAGKANLIEQNAAAFNGDIGITSPLFPEEECTETQADCLDLKTAEDITIERLNAVTLYTQLLSVPARRNFSKPEVIKGQKIFHQISCASCHTPSYFTGDSPIEGLANQRIYPYSDFLLHDMGDELADDLREYFNEDEATTREWRTPPLWGLGLIPTVNGHSRYLHDGRARSLEEAILWHGGEAQRSRDAFRQLPNTDRNNLIEFLNSL